MLVPTNSTTNIFSPRDVSVHWLHDARQSPPMRSLHHMLMQVRRQFKTNLNVQFVVNFPANHMMLFEEIIRRLWRDLMRFNCNVLRCMNRVLYFVWLLRRRLVQAFFDCMSFEWTLALWLTQLSAINGYSPMTIFYFAGLRYDVNILSFFYLSCSVTFCDSSIDLHHSLLYRATL